MAESSQASATSVLFARGVIARLALWPVLRAAVENGWGGAASAQKRTWLASELVDAFESAHAAKDTLDEEYVTLMLLQAMEDEFDVTIEDGSAELVARDVLALWGSALSGEESLVREWETRAAALRGKRVDVNVQETVKHVDESGRELDEQDDDETEDEDEETDDDMNVDEAPQLTEIDPPRHRQEPIVDEDGFTLVQSKAKRSNR